MKKIYFLFLLIGLIGCSEESLTEMENTSSKEVIATTRSGGDGKYDLLGYGYDITREYFSSSPSSIKGQVIDTYALEHDYTDRVDSNITPSSYGVMISGSTAEDYINHLTQHAKINIGPEAFVGNLEATFTSSLAYTSKYSLAQYMLYIRQKQLYYDAPIDLLSYYLTAKFKEDIRTQSPEYIIQHYGTNVLTNIVLGQRLNIVYRSAILSNTTNKTAKVEAGCSSNILKIFNIKVDGSYDETLKTDNSEQLFIYKTEGGNPGQAFAGTLNLDSEMAPQIDLSSWQSSCNTSNMVLIDAMPGTAIPLYEFVTDPAKKQALKDAIVKYMQERSYVDRGEPVPLYRYTFYEGDINHQTGYYYTTDFSEYGQGNEKYTYDKIMCYVYPSNSHPSGTVPLYEYQVNYFCDGGRVETYRTANIKSYYTTEWNKYGQGDKYFKYRRIVCYVYDSSSKPEGTTELYSYSSGSYPVEKITTYITGRNGKKIPVTSYAKVNLCNYVCDLSEVPIDEHKDYSRPSRPSTYERRETQIECYVWPMIAPK